MIVAKCDKCSLVMQGGPRDMIPQRMARHMLRCGHTLVKQGLTVDTRTVKKVAGKRVKQPRVASRPLPVSKVQYVDASLSDVEEDDEQRDANADETPEAQARKKQEKTDEEFIAMTRALGDAENQYLINFIRSGKTISFNNLSQRAAIEKRIRERNGNVQWTAHHITLSHADLPDLVKENEEPVEFIFNAPDSLQLLRATFGDPRNRGSMVLSAKKSMNYRENRQVRRCTW